MYVDVWEEEGTNGPGNSWRDTISVDERKTGCYVVSVRRRSYPDRGPSFWAYRSRPIKSPARFLDALGEALCAAGNGATFTSTDFLHMFACIAAVDGPFASVLLREHVRRLDGDTISRDLQWR